MGTQFFYALTPDAVLSAIESAGFELTGHCTALNSFENRVYDLKQQSGEHIVAKFYRPGRWTQAQILAEHNFLRQLTDAEVPVCAPMTLDDGSTLGEAEGIFFAVWPRTGGRSPEEIRDADVAILGRTVARLHNVGASSDDRVRGVLNADTYARAPVEELLKLKALPRQYEKRYVAAAHRIADLCDTLAAGVPVHRIHGDCHKGNVLNNGQHWFLLDFDDCLTGPAVQDVWLLLPDADAYGQRQRALFIEAYRQFRSFDTAWLNLIEPLRALRYIHFAAWLARRWEDPAFPAAFPHFGTEAYWEANTADLELQLEKIRASEPGIHTGAVDRANAEPERELTNKDFFWDME